MIITRAHKILMYPSPEQVSVLRKSCGISRFTYNWALSRWKELKSEGVKKVTRNDLKKEWNSVKPDWVYDAPKDANQQPFTDLYSGFLRYYKGQCGFPKYKKKGKSRDSFYISNDRVKVTNNTIKLPRIGMVRISEPLRYSHSSLHIMSYTVSCEADKWYVSITFNIDESVINKPSKNGLIGLDVGLKTFVTDSNGKSHRSPKPLKKHKSKLKRLQRQLARKKRNSKNRIKAKKKVQSVHFRIKNIRKHFLHNLSHLITKYNKVIVIEDLNIKGMLKNHKLAFHISDASWGEFMRQLEYKSKQTTSILIRADRFFPSSKTCSQCGYIKDKIELSEREYICEECGCTEDRDVNASVNLLAWGIAQLIPEAIGEFTPVEIVALGQELVPELNTINETSYNLDHYM